MEENRYSREKLNIFIPFVCQVVTVICGFILPRLLIRHYGSEAYGATASIIQFLSYIALLEGGIGGVARAALYKPLAENNLVQISSIFYEIKRFFNVIGCVFAVYVIFLASVFKTISNVQCFDGITTAFLVFAISISTFGQYFIGISSVVLLEASQRQYISNIVNVVTMIFNTILVVILVLLNCNLVIVKLFSSLIYFLRPVLLSSYVKYHFTLSKEYAKNKVALQQKWSGLGQHIAFFLHSNTDVVVLTFFGNLTSVAVYAVYNMVVGSIQNLTVSFVTGMEALFGEMLAKNEIKLLHKAFDRYETLISFISLVMYGTTASMIVPFVRVYSMNVTDANYIAPLFSFLLTVASFTYCLRTPCHAITIAAGHFKQTQVAAYAEAIINIVVSAVMVKRFGLVGVAIGTVLAVSFRFVYYVVYLSKNIFYRGVRLFVKRCIVNVVCFTIIFVLSSSILSFFKIQNYLHFFALTLLVMSVSILIATIFNYIFYKASFTGILLNIFKNRI